MARIDAAAEFAAIREHLAMARRRRYRESRLERHRAEIVALRRAGASLRDLVVWLRMQRRCCVARSTVLRYLRRLPELQEGP